MKKISTGYVPRPWALKIHANLTQRNCLVVHRRGGKTVLSSNHINHKAIQFNKMDPLTGSPLLNPQFAYVATTIGQVEKIAWPYFKQYLHMMPGVKFNEQKLRVTFPHPRGTCTIFCLGAENYDAHRGMYFDGVVLDEFADMHPDTRDKVFLPALRDRDGWELTLGTPKGDNTFKKVYMNILTEMMNGNKNYFASLQNIYDTQVFNERQIQEMRLEMSEEAFNQEMMCDFNAAPSGYFYQRYMDDAVKTGRVCSVPYDPAYPVSTYWDLGVSDSCAIWFIQEIGKEIHAIDHIEEHGRGLDYYARELMNRPYNYNTHYVPHDAASREISTGKSRVDFMMNNGLRNIQVVPRSRCLADDINAVRLVLPKVWFDKEKCKRGIECLRGFERKYDAKNMVFSENALHNWASHSADAFRQFAVSYEPGFGRFFGSEQNRVPQMAESSYDLFKW